MRTKFFSGFLDSILKSKEFKFVFLMVFIVLIIGAVFYHLVEGFTLFDSLYFSVITLTTIGYGDLYPTTDLGKLFTIFYVFIGIALIVSFVGVVSKIQIEEYRKIEERRVKRERKKIEESKK